MFQLARRGRPSAVTSVLCGIGVAVVLGSYASGQSNQAQHAALSSVEDIYIGRSVRESHIQPTDYCSSPRISFPAANEDQFSFRSISINSSDGRITDANVQKIGELHACFGQTSDPAVTNFYAEGRLGGISFKGIGECRVVKPNFPEGGLYPLRCFLNLSDLPAEFIGGELTTNSVLSRKALGIDTDPPGYTQASIATVRLWKGRTAH